MGAYTGESSHGAPPKASTAPTLTAKFEVMWMLPREDWGDYENAAPVDRLDIDAEVGRWGGVATAGRLINAPVERSS
jgi:hypothetical protein